MSGMLAPVHFAAPRILFLFLRSNMKIGISNAFYAAVHISCSVLWVFLEWVQFFFFKGGYLVSSSCFEQLNSWERGLTFQWLVSNFIVFVGIHIYRFRQIFACRRINLLTLWHFNLNLFAWCKLQFILLIRLNQVCHFCVRLLEALLHLLKLLYHFCIILFYFLQFFFDFCLFFVHLSDNGSGFQFS